MLLLLLVMVMMMNDDDDDDDDVQNNAIDILTHCDELRKQFLPMRWEVGHNNDVIFIKIFNASHKLNFLQNVYFVFFYILKTNRMTPFCNLFMERPSY